TKPPANSPASRDERFISPPVVPATRSETVSQPPASALRCVVSTGLESALGNPISGANRGRELPSVPAAGVESRRLGDGEDLLAGGGRTRLSAAVALEPQPMEAAGGGMASQRGSRFLVEAVAP